MLSLESPRWSELQHAYGDASDIPELLRQLESAPDSAGTDEPWFSIWSALAHQGDVYSASFAAVPHVVRILAGAPEHAGGVYFQFPAWVEICRHNRDTAVPPDLLPAYRDALAALPSLAASAASRAWDDEFAASVLAAVAAAKGFPEIAEVTLELTSDIAREVLEWLSER